MGSIVHAASGSICRVGRTGYPNFLIKPGDVNNLVVPVDGAGPFAFTQFPPLIMPLLAEMPSKITYPGTLLNLILMDMLRG